MWTTLITWVLAKSCIQAFVSTAFISHRHSLLPWILRLWSLIMAAFMSVIKDKKESNAAIILLNNSSPLDLPTNHVLACVVTIGYFHRHISLYVYEEWWLNLAEKIFQSPRIYSIFTAVYVLYMALVTRLRVNARWFRHCKATCIQYRQPRFSFRDFGILFYPPGYTI